jgi:hypothetical protein
MYGNPARCRGPLVLVVTRDPPLKVARLPPMLPLDLKTWYNANASWIGLLSLILAIVAIPLAVYLAAIQSYLIRHPVAEIH